MGIFETSATVGEQGQVHLAGVPFAPGTKVEVTISAKVPAEQELARASDDELRHGTGLRWKGNVLVHLGIGAVPSVTELRDERLSHLGEGR